MVLQVLYLVIHSDHLNQREKEVKFCEMHEGETISMHLLIMYFYSLQ